LQLDPIALNERQALREISAFLATKAASASSFDLVILFRILALIFVAPSINLMGSYTLRSAN
jgi:hypothetical protein